MSQPTDAAADYLMTIRYMHGEGQPVIAARLAERMGVSAATVSEMVNRLAREGLLAVDETTRQLELTNDGRATAERTFRRHALSEWLLTEVIGLGWAEADEEAHHLQHAFSERVTDRIDDLLGHPPTCPHGNPIPRDGRTPERPAGIPLERGRGRRRGHHPARHRGGGGGRAPAHLPAGARRAAGQRVRSGRGGGAHRHHDPARTERGGDAGTHRRGQAAGAPRKSGSGSLPSRPGARAARRRRHLGNLICYDAALVTKNRNRRIIIATVSTVLWLGYMVVGLALINYIYPTERGQGPEGTAAFIGLIWGVVTCGFVMWAAQD